MNVLRRRWRGDRNLCFIYPLLHGITLFTFLGVPLLFQGVTLREGQVSPRDVVAPEAVEIVDVVATEKRKNEILATLSPVYRVDETLVRQIEEEIEGFFSTLESLRRASLSPLPETIENLARTWNVTPKTISWLLGAPQDTYEALRGFLYDLFATHLFFHPVSHKEAPRVLLAMSARIEESGFSGEAMWVAGLLMTRFFRPNAVIDERRTSELQARILASFEPVRRVIRQGETILQRGDVVTASHLQALEALGMLGGSWRFWRIVVLLFFVAAVELFEYWYFSRFAPCFLNDSVGPLVRTVALATVLALSLLTTRISGAFFVVGAFPLILLTLFGREVTLGESLLLFPLLLWAWSTNLEGSMLLFVHLMLPVFFDGSFKRRYLVKAGGMLAPFGMAAVALASLYESVSKLQLVTLVYGGIGGFMASLVALGGVSLFEHLFHVTTDVRLMELLNPNHPLLKRLMFEAPGTYSHSLVVANLAEVAAEEIGANALLARVGAYYHDIGKLKRPQWFIENQANPERNIHNRLSPYLSALVIMNHVRDGLRIAREFRLPREVQDIIQSHHGRSVVRYFYEKALRSEGKEVSREVFRYPGPLPKTPEEAIVFLADSVEAAVRSMKDPTSRRVEVTVRSIVRTYLEDGQLDDSSLTLRDINRIAHRFVLFLNGMLHARVPYPELTMEGNRGEGYCGE
ncbi:MAG: HDIG domain-containing protein [Candidatus Caldatribacterium sp.]|uniref:HD family phosphohydrolase n=1 Tax=Candidatus Caldatribacterium sp. TaxID=2282143 RepID=UPI0037EC1973|nr:HDIG domain-containing protein [Candidatus Caldatribacterium sp.]